MDAESAVIQQQMEETRHALSEKLETLEQQVAENMQEASQAVAESVDTVKETVDAVHETVAAVKESVEETVANMKGSVEETVTSIKDTFDLGLQVREHPWVMVGASVFVGYLIGNQPKRYASADSPRRQPRAREFRTRNMPDSRWAAEPQAFAGPEVASPLFDRDEPVFSEFPVAAPAAKKSHHWHWLSNLVQAFRPEIANLQELAIESVAGAIGEMIAETAPPRLKPELTSMVDRVAHRIAGDPSQSPPFK